MIYIIAISLLYLYFVLDSPIFKLRIFFYFVLFMLGVISIFRAVVGVDTLNYNYLVSSIRSGESLFSLELGFAALIWLLSNLFNSDILVVRIIALIYLSLTTIYYIRADKDEKYVLVSYMIPAFYFSFSMNTIRLGLASMIFMLCAQHANKLKRGRKLWLPFVSFIFHYSMLFPAFYRWAIMVRWRLKSVFTAVLLLLCSVYIIFLNADYFLQKWEAYGNSQSPSEYSGMSVVIIILFLLTGLALSKMPKQRKNPLIVISSALTILFYFLARYTYGGLRALGLLSFVLPIIILNIYKSYNLRLCRSLRICFFFAGLIYFAAFYRNIYMDTGIGEAPFLPYNSILF